MADRNAISQNQQALEKDDESKFFAIPLEIVPVDTPLPYPVYVKVAEQFILFRVLGDQVSTHRVNALAEKITRVFIKSSDWEKFLSSLEDKVTETDLASDESDPDAQNEVVHVEAHITRLRHLLVAYGEEMERRNSLQPETLTKLRQLGDALAIGIQEKPELGSRILRRYKDPQLYFVNHSVNVATYSAAVANKLNIPNEDIKLLTFAALVHNVGKLFIPREVLYKPGSLNDEEWALIMTHPDEGARLLEKLKAPREVVLTALQHHERMDGEGYPHEISGGQIHLFSKIVSIADVFDALTNHSPYQVGISPQDAIKKMLAMNGKFDPQILKMVYEDPK